MLKQNTLSRKAFQMMLQQLTADNTRSIQKKCSSFDAPVCYEKCCQSKNTFTSILLPEQNLLLPCTHRVVDAPYFSSVLNYSKSSTSKSSFNCCIFLSMSIRSPNFMSTRSPNLFVWYLMAAGGRDESLAGKRIYKHFEEELSDVDNIVENEWVGYVIVDRCLSTACMFEHGKLEKHWSKFLKRYSLDVAPRSVFGYRIVHFEKFDTPIKWKPQLRGNGNFKLSWANSNILKHHMRRLRKTFLRCKLTHRGMQLDKRLACLVLGGHTSFIFRPWKRLKLFVPGMHNLLVNIM